MNEKINEGTENIEQSIGDNTELSADIAVHGGRVLTDVSSESDAAVPTTTGAASTSNENSAEPVAADNYDAAGSVSSGDAEVFPYLSETSGLQGGTLETEAVTEVDLTPVIERLDSVVKGLNCIVFLLLFVWIEKKIKMAVRNFTGGKYHEP